MLAKSLPGIRTNSQAKSGTEPATKWGCHTDTPTTAEITTEQTGRSSLLFIGGSIVPQNRLIGKLNLWRVVVAQNPVSRELRLPRIRALVVWIVGQSEAI